MEETALPSIASNNSERIAIGRVRKPFGLKGQLAVDGFGKALGALRTPHRVLWGFDDEHAMSAEVSEIRDTPKGFICKFKESDTIEDAEAYRGAYLFLEKNELPKLGLNEYYTFELEGMTVVVVPSGKSLGVVTGVQNFPTVDALNVRKDDGSTVLVSVNKGIIEKIDREKGCITVFESALEQIV